MATRRLTWGQLPVRPRRHVVLVCSKGCPGTFSACRSDYWLAHTLRDTMACFECGAPLKLARKVTVYRTISPKEAESAKRT